MTCWSCIVLLSGMGNGSFLSQTVVDGCILVDYCFRATGAGVVDLYYFWLGLLLWPVLCAWALLDQTDGALLAAFAVCGAGVCGAFSYFESSVWTCTRLIF